MRFKLLYIEGMYSIRCNGIFVLGISAISQDIYRIYVSKYYMKHPLKLVYRTLFRDFVVIRNESLILVLFTSLVLL